VILCTCILFSIIEVVEPEEEEEEEEEFILSGLWCVSM
jgi:hypothetical protein